MKLIFSSLGISVLLLSHLYAGKVILKDGTCLEIPEKLLIFNDLEKTIFVEEKVEEPEPTEEQKLFFELVGESMPPQRLITGRTIPVAQEDEFEVNKEKKSLSPVAQIVIEFNSSRYPLRYPAYSYPDAVLAMGAVTVFKYKASDVIKNLCDERGFTMQRKSEPVNTQANQIEELTAQLTRLNERQIEINKLKEEIARMEQLQKLFEQNRFNARP